VFKGLMLTEGRSKRNVAKHTFIIAQYLKN